MEAALDGYIKSFNEYRVVDTKNGKYEREVRFFNVKNGQFQEYGVSKGTWSKIKDWGLLIADQDSSKVPTWAKINLETAIVDSETSQEASFRQRTIIQFEPSNRRAEKYLAEVDVGKYTKKILVHNQDMMGYGLRFSTSFESDSGKQRKFKPEETTIRTAERYSYLLFEGRLRLDCSEVSMSTVKNKKTYEVELEILKPIESPSNLKAYILNVLGVIQETKFIYTYQLRDRVIQDYNRGIRSTSLDVMQMDDLVQPRNIKFKDLTWGNLIGGPYSYTVSFKADGLRRVLFFHETGIWLLHPPFLCNYILKTPPLQACPEINDFLFKTLEP